MYLLTHSLVLVLVAVMKPKVLKTKISHADPPTLSLLVKHNPLNVVRRLGLGICPSTSHSHSHTLTITCTCCCDGIYGAQDLKISHAHSLIVCCCHCLLLSLPLAITVSHCLLLSLSITVSLAVFASCCHCVSCLLSLVWND